MSTSPGGRSATIHQFPVGRRQRASHAADVRAADPKRVTYLPSLRYCDAAFGSSWYHEAAVREAEQARTR